MALVNTSPICHRRQMFWGFVLQAAAIKAGALDMYTCSFQRDAGDLVLLLGCTRGKSKGKGPLPPPGSGEDCNWHLDHC